MQKITFGIPEEHVPSKYCSGFHYIPTEGFWNSEKFSFKKTKTGCVIEWEIDPDTQIFGFGLQLKRFNQTGNKVAIRANADPTSPNGDSHAPVPFLITNKGYGIYFDTARYAEFYCGRPRRTASVPQTDISSSVTTSTEELYSAKPTTEQLFASAFIPNAEGIDLYVIEGNTITEIVSQYNMLSGGGPEVPEWGLGVLYRCHIEFNDTKVLEIADYFRSSDIPCDIIGLEPGWQTHAYSCTYEWNPERFPDVQKFIGKLKEKGYHLNVWEHAFTHPTSPIYEQLIPLSGDYTVFGGLVPDFTLPEAKSIFAGQQKQALVDLGIDGFKLDECDGSDNTGGWSFPNHTEFPSGLDGEQYHNLIGTLYAQTIMQSLDGQPTFSEIRNIGALASSYPFVLYSDLYDHRDFVRGVVTSGMSGLLWSPEVRHAESKKDMIRRLQSVVFSVQCLINGWYCKEVPWKELDCENEVRDLLKLRHELIPMLKKAFDCYRDTGKPPVRALVMDYTNDPETYQIDDEYLFCEDLLVAPIIGTESDEREVYLPEGNWVDFFTGEPVKAGRFVVCTEGIPVYRKIS